MTLTIVTYYLKNVGLFLTDKTPLNELFNKTVPKEKSDEELYPSLFGNDDV